MLQKRIQFPMLGTLAVHNEGLPPILSLLIDGQLSGRSASDSMPLLSYDNNAIKPWNPDLQIHLLTRSCSLLRVDASPKMHDFSVHHLSNPIIFIYVFYLELLHFSV